jgi:hypothetical protein
MIFNITYHDKLNLTGHVRIALGAIIAKLLVLSLSLRVGQQVLLGVDVEHVRDRVVTFNVYN